MVHIRIEDLEKYAKENNVPIMLKSGIDYLTKAFETNDQSKMTFAVVVGINNLLNKLSAIEKGKFTIYTVERVEEAIEILMDVKFDEVKRLVIERLRGFNELQSPSKK